MPQPYSVLVFTNYAWHWEEGADAPPSQSRYVLPFLSQHPLPPHRVDELYAAVEQYGFVPNDVP